LGFKEEFGDWRAFMKQRPSDAVKPQFSLADKKQRS